MLLSQYLTVTRSLIQTPQSTIPLISDALLAGYINIARGQVAGQGECVLSYGTMAVSAASQQYPFSEITLTNAAGIQGVMAIRMITFRVGDGAKRVTAREWPWFNTYEIAQPVPAAGPPRVWAQYGQGALGSIFLNLLDDDYTLNVDTKCFPGTLVDDNTADPIPYLWTDAVPFYAAYYAYMAFQKDQEADAMMKRFQEAMDRARAAVTPSILPGSFTQGADPMAQNRLGVQPSPRGAG